MKFLRNYLNKIKPKFEEGGKLHAFRSLYDGFETFLFVPNDTSKSGVNIHDAIDSKRIMSLVVIALIPSLLLGMYNIGLQNAIAAGTVDTTCWFDMFLYGLVVTLPKIVVAYVVGLGIEFTVAQWKKEEIHEGFLVSGILIPMIVPVGCPLWVLALATAFAVIFAKEVFGGTGMNIVNVALIARAFIFFAYPQVISGDGVWVATEEICGLGANVANVDGYTCATALQQIADAKLDALPAFANDSTLTFATAFADGAPVFGADAATAAAGNAAALSVNDMIFGFMPGSIGETSVIAIALGAALLLFTGVASWKTMLSVFVGGIAMSLLFQHTMPENPVAQIPFWQHIILGGFCFGAVFMATDPVTSARTEKGKYIYGFGIGAMAILIRVMNPGYPEGMMLAILLMNVVAPFIDYCVVQSNVKARAKRVTKKN
ncbi:MAG: NADH:ubiquinone reductase (Na(+)-transporting) subunit B [Bacteroidaceae bacterium]|nr:NADH:ubiquinone reductase (Na(+)-transporting) subunit B [Bacteroidaceae bacterium]